MTGSRPRRPAHATVVAYLALFLALSGAAYAGSKVRTKDLKAKAVTTKKLAPGAVKTKKLGNNAVKTPKLADGAVTTDKLANDAVATAKIADDAVTGKKVDESTLDQVPSALNADTVDGKNAVCDAGTQLFAGVCLETAARAAVVWKVAAQTCAAAGGSLPSAGLLYAASQSGFTLSATDEWADDLNEVTALDNFQAVTVSAAGGINLTNATADNKGYRCAIPLVH